MFGHDEWFFDTELLLSAERRGNRSTEVPVDWIEDLDSRVDVASTVLEDVKGSVPDENVEVVRIEVRCWRLLHVTVAAWSVFQNRGRIVIAPSYRKYALKQRRPSEPEPP